MPTDRSAVSPKRVPPPDQMFTGRQTLSVPKNLGMFLSPAGNALAVGDDPLCELNTVCDAVRSDSLRAHGTGGRA